MTLVAVSLLAFVLIMAIEKPPSIGPFTVECPAGCAHEHNCPRARRCLCFDTSSPACVKPANIHINELYFAVIFATILVYMVISYALLLLIGVIFCTYAIPADRIEITNAITE